MKWSGDKIFTSSDDLSEVEQSFKKLFSAKEVLWTGRAATSLFFLFQSIRKCREDVQTPEVILPALSCATPASVAIMCGIKVRFADVELESGLIDLKSIKEQVNRNTCAILFIHLYGNTRDLEDIVSWCSEKKIYLIEDVAQALGAKLPNGGVAGSVGHASIFSFNRTKIIESGGGALTIRDSYLLEGLREYLSNDFFPPNRFSQENYISYALSYRNLYHSLVHLMRKSHLKSANWFFPNLVQFYEGLYYKMDLNGSDLLVKFNELESNLRDRFRKAERYRGILGSMKEWKVLNGWETSGCCWRFNILLSSERNLVTLSERVRREGFHVSNLYWPVSNFFSSERYPNAEFFARRIINLWVDGSVDDEYVSRCASSLLDKIQ